MNLVIMSIDHMDAGVFILGNSLLLSFSLQCPIIESSFTDAGQRRQRAKAAIGLRRQKQSIYRSQLSATV